VDAYFQMLIFNAPNKASFLSTNILFGNLPGFSLGMANIIAYEGKKVGAVVDLVFVQEVRNAVFGSPPYNAKGGSLVVSADSTQLYVYWNVNGGCGNLTFEISNTFLAMR